MILSSSSSSRCSSTTLWGTSFSGAGNPFPSDFLRLHELGSSQDGTPGKCCCPFRTACLLSWYMRWDLSGAELCSNHRCFVSTSPEWPPVLRLFSSKQISPLPLNSAPLGFSGHVQMTVIFLANIMHEWPLPQFLIQSLFASGNLHRKLSMFSFS